MRITLLAAAALLAFGAVAHAMFALRTARPPTQPVPDRDGYLDRWQRLHGGYDPRHSLWVRGWLRLVYRAAAPLARRGVAPDQLTLSVVWPSGFVLVTAAAGGRWPLLGALLILLTGVVDTLDGAVAGLTGRASRWGYLLDSLVDRLADLAIVGALVLLGAAQAWGVAVGAGILLQEYARARGANAGAGEVEVVTVSERPTRIIVGIVGLIVAGVLPVYAEVAAGLALIVLGALTAGGLLQLLIVLHRRLSVPPPPGAPR